MTQADTLVRFAPPPAGQEVIALTALATGRLDYRDGCFRIVDAHRPGTGTTLVWPHDYVAVTRGARHGVRDPAGRTAFDGDHVRLGGGAIEALPANVIHRDRATGCGGPYFGAHLF